MSIIYAIHARLPTLPFHDMFVSADVTMVCIKEKDAKFGGFIRQSDTDYQLPKGDFVESSH